MAVAWGYDRSGKGLGYSEQGTGENRCQVSGDREQAPSLSPLAPQGAAFDFLAGTAKQAPAWMQENGLEWFF